MFQLFKFDEIPDLGSRTNSDNKRGQERSLFASILTMRCRLLFSEAALVFQPTSQSDFVDIWAVYYVLSNIFDMSIEQSSKSCNVAIRLEERIRGKTCYVIPSIAFNSMQRLFSCDEFKANVVNQSLLLFIFCTRTTHSSQKPWQLVFHTEL